MKTNNNAKSLRKKKLAMFTLIFGGIVLCVAIVLCIWLNSWGTKSTYEGSFEIYEDTLIYGDMDKKIQQYTPGKGCVVILEDVSPEFFIYDDSIYYIKDDSLNALDLRTNRTVTIYTSGEQVNSLNLSGFQNDVIQLCKYFDNRYVDVYIDILNSENVYETSEDEDNHELAVRFGEYQYNQWDNISVEVQKLVSEKYSAGPTARQAGDYVYILCPENLGTLFCTKIVYQEDGTMDLEEIETLVKGRSEPAFTKILTSISFTGNVFVSLGIYIVLILIILFLIAWAVSRRHREYK